MYNFSYGPRRLDIKNDHACKRKKLSIPCCGPEERDCYGWASHASDIAWVFNYT